MERGAVEYSGEGVGIGDDLADTHAAAAFSAAGDVERENVGEEVAQPMRRGGGEELGEEAGADRHR